MQIRKLLQEDYGYLASTITNGFEDGWNFSMLCDAYKGGNFFGFIALDNDKPIGYITYTVSMDFADIQSVFVEEDERKKGVASLLMNAVLEDLEKKVQKTLLEVREGNVPAINLYKKYGFSNLSVRRKYYPDGENALVMCKEN